MKLPATIRIGFLDYALEVCPSNSIDKGKSAGEYHFDGGHIRVDQNEIGVMCQRLMHECNHGILFNSGLDEVKGVADNEEALVNAFASGWLQIFRDNPWVLAYISKAVKS